MFLLGEGMTKTELINAIEAKVRRAKPIPKRLLTAHIKARRITKAELERIFKTIRVSRDGWDIFLND